MAHWLQQTAIDEACADGSPAGAGPRFHHQHKLAGLQYKQAKQRQKKGRKHLTCREGIDDISRFQRCNKMPIRRPSHQPRTLLLLEAPNCYGGTVLPQSAAPQPAAIVSNARDLKGTIVPELLSSYWSIVVPCSVYDQRTHRGHYVVPHHEPFPGRHAAFPRILKDDDDWRHDTRQYQH